MRETTFTLTDKFGMDAREASTFAQTASRFASSLQVTREGNSTVASGKDALELMLLVADHGARLTVKASGPDEAKALAALSATVSRWDAGRLRPVARRRRHHKHAASHGAARAHTWTGQLAALRRLGLTLGHLELLVEGSVGPLGARGLSLFDFQAPIGAWLAALRSSRPTHASRAAHLLRDLLADDLTARRAALHAAAK